MTYQHAIKAVADRSADASRLLRLLDEAGYQPPDRIQFGHDRCALVWIQHIAYLVVEVPLVGSAEHGKGNTWTFLPGVEAVSDLRGQIKGIPEHPWLERIKGMKPTVVDDTGRPSGFAVDARHTQGESSHGREHRPDDQAHRAGAGVDAEGGGGPGEAGVQARPQ